MSSEHTALPLYPMRMLLPFQRPSQSLPSNVTMESPAILVMTDLRQVTAITIEPNVSIAWALSHMKENGVSLLLVTNYRSEVLGLVTGSDLEGEKPLQMLQELGVRYEELQVRDLMTPYEKLDVMRLDDVLRGTVGEVVATLRLVARRHAVVIADESELGMPALRGLFSVSQISRQLGRSVETVVLPDDPVALDHVMGKY